MNYLVKTVTMTATVSTLAEALIVSDGRPAVIFRAVSFGAWSCRPFLVVQGESL
jgi:hypothetical protein